MYVGLLLKQINLTRQIRGQLGVRQAGDVVVVVGINRYALARRHRYRFRSENHTVEVIITLLQVRQNHLHAFAALAEQLVLCFERLLLRYQLTLFRGREEREEDIEEHYTHTYTSQYVPSGALEPIAEAVFHLFHLQSLGIDIKVRFCHNRIISLFSLSAAV